MAKEEEIKFKCVIHKCEKEAIYGFEGTLDPKHGPLYCDDHVKAMVEQDTELSTEGDDAKVQGN